MQALLDADVEVVAVYTQPDRAAGRGLKITQSPVKQLALAANIPVEQPASLKDEGEHFKLTRYKADIMIVVAYGLILPSAVLKIPRYGCLNVHASLLPRWRGASPIQHAIKAGDAETGITYMLMDAGMDTGPILKQVPVLLKPSWNSNQLHDCLAQLGAKYLVDVIHEWVTDDIKPQAQESEYVTYAPKINKEDANLNWKDSAKRLQHTINAFNPWPVAFSYLDGNRIRIYEVAVMASEAVMEPGTIINVRDNAIDVACGHHILSLLKCQLAGGKVMPMGEILKSKRDWFAIGKQFQDHL